MSKSELAFWKTKFYTAKEQNACMRQVLSKIYCDLLKKMLDEPSDVQSTAMYEQLKSIERAMTKYGIKLNKAAL